MRAALRVRRAAWRGAFLVIVALLVALIVLDRPGALWDAGVSKAPWRPVCVHLGTVMPDESFRWERETTGLLLAMLEGGFAMLDDTTVDVEGAPPPPGRPPCEVDSPAWTARLELGGTEKAVRTALWMCDQDRRCRILHADGVRDAPDAIATSLLTQASRILDRDPKVALGWTTRQSRDPYAQLLSGRSAAVFYGLVPAVPPLPEGAKPPAAPPRDPIDHAQLVDPRMPIAEWMVGRRALLRADGERALNSLVRGDRLGADPVDLALAVAHSQYGTPAKAIDLLDAVQEALPDDHRLALERAAALIAAKRLPKASAVLDALPAEMADLPRYLEIAVTWKEAAGVPLEPDGLLALWQQRAPNDPRPVRKRIEVLVGVDRFADALALTQELSVRGAILEARRLRLALAAELGQWSTAAAAATDLGDPVLAAALVGDVPAPTGRKRLAPVQLESLLVQGRTQLAAGQLQDVVETAGRLLEQDPWNPDALGMRADAYAKLGEDGKARSDLCRLRQVDPAHGDIESTGVEAIAWQERCGRAG